MSVRFGIFVKFSSPAFNPLPRGLRGVAHAAALRRLGMIQTATMEHGLAEDGKGKLHSNSLAALLLAVFPEVIEGFSSESKR